MISPLSSYTTIACLGPIGAMYGSGTIATLCTIPLILIIYSLSIAPSIQLLIAAIAILLGRGIIHKACIALNNHDDPSCIVLDELIGCIITFYAVPISTNSIIMGIILFRFFDITKIAGISYLERYPYGWGIVLDDVAAGILSNILLRMIIYY